MEGLKNLTNLFEFRILLVFVITPTLHKRYFNVAPENLLAFRILSRNGFQRGGWAKNPIFNWIKFFCTTWIFTDAFWVRTKLIFFPRHDKNCILFWLEFQSHCFFAFSSTQRKFLFDLNNERREGKKAEEAFWRRWGRTVTNPEIVGSKSGREREGREVKSERTVRALTSVQRSPSPTMIVIKKAKLYLVYSFHWFHFQCMEILFFQYFSCMSVAFFWIDLSNDDDDDDYLLWRCLCGSGWETGIEFSKSFCVFVWLNG